MLEGIAETQSVISSSYAFDHGRNDIPGHTLRATDNADFMRMNDCLKNPCSAPPAVILECRAQVHVVIFGEVIDEPLEIGIHGFGLP